MSKQLNKEARVTTKETDRDHQKKGLELRTLLAKSQHDDPQHLGGAGKKESKISKKMWPQTKKLWGWGLKKRPGR